MMSLCRAITSWMSRGSTPRVLNRSTWKTRLGQALAKVPEELLSDEEKQLKNELAQLPEIAILHLIYQQKSYEGHAKDHEFSATSMREHWQSGYEDTKRTLKHKDWLTMPVEGTGLVVHDVHREDEFR